MVYFEKVAAVSCKCCSYFFNVRSGKEWHSFKGKCNAFNCMRDSFKIIVLICISNTRLYVLEDGCNSLHEL